MLLVCVCVCMGVHSSLIMQMSNVMLYDVMFYGVQTLMPCEQNWNMKDDYHHNTLSDKFWPSHITQRTNQS